MSQIPSYRHLTMVVCDACHKYENVSNAHYDENTQQVLCSSCKNDYLSDKKYEDYVYEDFCLEFSWLPCGFIENNMHILSKKYVRDALNDPNRYIIILNGHLQTLTPDSFELWANHHLSNNTEIDLDELVIYRNKKIVPFKYWTNTIIEMDNKQYIINSTQQK